MFESWEASPRLATPSRSRLLESCETLRKSLVKAIADQSPHGMPALGPVLIFLEDPKRHVLRPASRVTWGDLRLEPVLRRVLLTCAELLDALRNGFADASNESMTSIVQRIPGLQRAANEAWDEIVKALTP